MTRDAADALTPDFACTLCGCVCDDLTIRVRGNRVVEAERACAIARPWLLAQTTEAGAVPALVGAAPAELSDACAEAARLLKLARSPAIYGLSRSSTDGQRAAVELADRLGATIDTSASVGHAPSILALQQVGESTCSLGEVRQRADLVVYWGSDPDATHPRHRERYTPPGVATVVVGASPNATAGTGVTQFIEMPPGGDFVALWGLRLLVAGHAVPDADPQLVELAGRLTAARWRVVFFGAGLVQTALAHRSVEALLQLVRDLNASGRAYARRMRRYGDVAGADSVLAWQTGYPFGVNLAAGYPRYCPGEFTVPQMLERGEIDALVLVGSETLAGFPEAALRRLADIPVVALDPPGVLPPVAPAVRFNTATYGVHRGGTAYRLDEIPIPLRPVLPTHLPTDAEVLLGVLGALGEDDDVLPG